MNSENRQTKNNYISIFFYNHLLKFCILCSLRYVVDFVLLMLMERLQVLYAIFLTTVCTISVFCADRYIVEFILLMYMDRDTELLCDNF